MFISLACFTNFCCRGVEDEQVVPRGAWVQGSAGDRGYRGSVRVAPEQGLTLPFAAAGLLPACLGCPGALGLGGPETLVWFTQACLVLKQKVKVRT